jgi:hypothetical protein
LIYVDSNRHLVVRRSGDAVNWDAPSVIDGTSVVSYQPSAVPVDKLGVLHVFAVRNGNSVYEVSWNGVNGFNAVDTGEFSNHGPYAVFWNSQFYLTWAGTASNNPIYIKHGGKDGWSPATLVSGNFGYPALFPIGAGLMEMVYRGNTARIYHTYTTDGVSFGPVGVDNASATNFTPIPFMGTSDAHNSAWVFYTGQNSQYYTMVE